MRVPKDLLLLCALGAGLRLLFIFMVPMVEAPDEFAHYWVLKFICEHLALPSPQDVIDGGPSAVYGSMPQLGYLPHIVTAKLLPFGDISLTPRFGSLIMGLVTIAVAYFLGEELFGARLLLARALPLLVVFHPQLVLVHSYSNNDATTCALASLTLLLAVRTLKMGPKLSRSVTMGALLGWIALAKYSGLAVLPIALLAVAAAGWLHGTGLVASLGNIAALCAVPVLTSGWWFMRNYQIYHGDILGTQTMRHSWSITYKRPLDFYMTPWQVVKQKPWWRSSFYSFWALFGYMSKFLYRPLYLLYFLFVSCSALGGIINLVRGKQEPPQGPSGRLALVDTCVWWMFALCFLFNLAGMVWASTVNLGGPQGRYLFASELPAMALIILGLTQFGPRLGNRLVLALVIYNALVCIGSYIWLVQSYGAFHLKTY